MNAFIAHVLAGFLTILYMAAAAGAGLTNVVGCIRRGPLTADGFKHGRIHHAQCAMNFPVRGSM